MALIDVPVKRSVLSSSFPLFYADPGILGFARYLGCNPRGILRRLVPSRHMSE